MNSPRPFLYIRNLTIRFPGPNGPTEVVRGLDLTVYPGESVALVGESGSGKSVTARALIGLAGTYADVKADVFEINGEDVLQYRERDWRRLRGSKIGFVLQDALVSLDPLRRIGQQLSDAFGERQDLPAKYDRSLDILQSVGIKDPERRLSQYPHQLSGGLRQRALIATAIAQQPSLVIADEPTTALDVTVQRQVLDLLKQRQRAGNTLLIISHDLSVVSQLADQVLVMRNGEVVEQGKTAEVLSGPSHPYTRQLLDAIPTASSRGYRLSPVALEHSDEISLIAPAAAPNVRIALPQKQIDAGRHVLVVDRLQKRYGRSTTGPLAVNNVSFELAAGEALGIVGESGSGKTTVAKMVLGLVDPDAGNVWINGQPWSRMDESQRRPHRAGIQLIAQDSLSSFDPRYNVEKLIGESLDAVGIFGDNRRRRVLEVLDAVRLGPTFLNRHPRELSGGQRQRVAIARAFAPRPQLLVADEPVSALDVSIQAQVLDLLAELQAEFGASLLFISHDLGVVHHLTDKVIVMKAGQVVESGDVEKVFAGPRHSYTQELLAARPSLN
ncbi:dipeptide ABC transporter ATP-binding protein [Phyllobacterium sophorae]|uniref:ABC transporter ATP-binding protein n=1 Tax=Phyllobacterium sophorae TaxID=1520277 RepID=A0A2P7BFE0_9HYPH|nr:ABC transporter ATP-binding protein [Phyllobacterium sophorae]PSH65204.1 ABC transporter ATP-binding protein [Phyllobacterium sophorae]